jgi:hypothetical protein
MLSQKKINHMVYNALPKQISASVNLDTLCVDLYEEAPIFATAYIDFIQRYNKTRYAAQSEEDYKQLILGIDDLLKRGVQEIDGLQKKPIDTSLVITTIRIVLDCFIQHLYEIKQTLTLAQELHINAAGNIHLLDIRMQYHRSITSSQFAQFYKEAQGQQRATLDAYITTVSDYFASNQHPHTPLFIYDCEKILSELRSLKSPAWQCWYAAQNQLIDEMVSILSALEKQSASLQQNDQPSQENGQNFIQRMLSGNYTGMLTTAGQFIATRIATYLTKNPPHNHFSEFLGIPPQPSTPENNQKLIDFALRNPEVLKTMCEQHPEIIDILAKSIKQADASAPSGNAQ